MGKHIREATNSTIRQTQGVTRRGFVIGSVGASVAMAMVPAALLSGCAEEILNRPGNWLLYKGSPIFINSKSRIRGFGD